MSKLLKSKTIEALENAEEEKPLEYSDEFVYPLIRID